MLYPLYEEALFSEKEWEKLHEFPLCYKLPKFPSGKWLPFSFCEAYLLLILEDWERKLFKMAARMSKNSWYETNTKGDSTHLSRNFLWLGCQQVGFWYEHFWFGSLVPSWFCQTTNQEELCEFSTHVSSWDFVLWLSSWSQLRCLQRCTQLRFTLRKTCVGGYVIHFT